MADEITERTQRIVEGAHYSMREYNLKLDDVINDQRRVIYNLRDKILARDEVFDLLGRMLDETVEFVIEDSCPAEEIPENFDYDRIERTMNSLLLEPIEITRPIETTKELFDLYEEPMKELHAFMDQFRENEDLVDFLPAVMISYIDSMWVRHLESMTRLKEGIGLRSYGQEDPMQVYQREGLYLFGQAFQRLRRNIAAEVTQFMKKILTPQQEEQ